MSLTRSSTRSSTGSSKGRLLALHGFLGTSRDWDFFKDRFSDRLDIFAPDLFSAQPSGESLSEEAQRVGDTFLNWSNSAANVLLGYSYGGRLAVEIFLRFPEKFSKLILVSAGFGMANQSERLARAKADELWAERMENMNWEELLKLWNGQEVLSANELNQMPGPREEILFNRKRLAEALRLRGQAQMGFQLSKLAKVTIPTLLLAGLHDTKYVESMWQAREQLPNSELCVFEGASHRLPWQQKDLFCARIQEFIFSVV